MPKENAACTAAVDLGSNTFRLLIGRRDGNALRVDANLLEPTGLGRGLQHTGTLTEEGMRRALTALAAFREELSRWPVTSIRACGTEALRHAGNSEVFLGKARELLGSRVETLAGHEEARLTLLGARSAMRAETEAPLLLVDVGGGSTECILSADGLTATRVTSIPLGVIGLTEAFPCNGSPPAELSRMTRLIGESLDGALTGFPPLTSSGRVLASGGSATALAALDLGLTRYEASSVQGHQLSRERLGELFFGLARLPVAERNRLPGLDRGRGEILPAGARVYEILLQTLGSSAMMVSDAGLLEGILLSQFPDEDLILIKEY